MGERRAAGLNLNRCAAQRNRASDRLENAMTVKDILENTKSAFDLARDFLIAVLIVAFLAYPPIINRALTGLGIDEFDLWGFKGKTSLSTVAQDLAFQRQVNATLTAELERLNASPEIVEAARAAQANADQTLSANATQIAVAQEATASSGPWAVVFGADTTLADAMQEINRAKANRFEEANVYFRQGWYRSAISFATREAATAALARIKNLSRHSGGAYIVDLAQWCSRSAQRGDSVLACS
jgi:hypothetical protein